MVLNPSLSCWTQIYPVFANSVDPDQLSSEEANWSGSALFATKYVNLYQQPWSNNLIGWKFKVGVASYFIQQGKGETFKNGTNINKTLFELYMVFLETSASPMLY